MTAVDQTAPQEAAAAGYVTEGLLAGTRLATTLGWRDVTELQPGAVLVSLEAGFVEVRALLRAVSTVGSQDWPRALWPLEIPAGALGNKRAFRLLPEQVVLVTARGEPLGVPAAALEGHGGITRCPPQLPEEVVIVQLAEGCHVCAEGDLQLYCPADDGGLPPGFLPAADGPEIATLGEARRLIAALQAAAEPPKEAPQPADQAALRAVSP